MTKRSVARSDLSRVMTTRGKWAIALCSLATLGICGNESLYAQSSGIRSVAYANVEPIEMNHEFDLNDDALDADADLTVAPSPTRAVASPNADSLLLASDPASETISETISETAPVPNLDLVFADEAIPEAPARRRSVSRPINVPDTIPNSSSGARANASSVYAPANRQYAPARNGVISNAVGTPVAQTAAPANRRVWSSYAAPQPVARAVQPASQPVAQPVRSGATSSAAPVRRERLASITLATPGAPAGARQTTPTASVGSSRPVASPDVASPDVAYAENVQPAPAVVPADANVAAQPATTRIDASQTESTQIDASQRPESLDDAIRIALAQSRSQQALAYQRRAAESTARAASTLRNPKINNTTSYVGLLNKPTTVSDVDVAGAVSQAANTYIPDVAPILEPVISALPSLPVATPLTDRNFVTSATSVTIPIYLGGRIRALEEAANAMTQAVAAGETIGEQTVKIETVEAYFLVLRARRLREVAHEAVEAAESHLKDAERMFNVGMVTKNVELAAQVAVSEAKQLELKVANAQALAESAYNRLMWRPLDAPVNIVDMELVEPLGNLDSLTELAIRSRPELQALAAETRAINAQVKVARADVLPQVAAGGAYTYFENSHMKDNSNATAAIGVSWTPFDGGTSRARQNAARQSAMAVARVRDNVESAIRLEVRQATLAESEARERLNVARVAADQAEENYRVVTRGFQEGMLNHTEVLDATTMRTAAKSSLANAKYDAILATERLKRAVGIL